MDYKDTLTLIAAKLDDEDRTNLRVVNKLAADTIPALSEDEQKLAKIRVIFKRLDALGINVTDAKIDLLSNFYAEKYVTIQQCLDLLTEQKLDKYIGRISAITIINLIEKDTDRMAVIKWLKDLAFATKWLLERYLITNEKTIEFAVRCYYINASDELSVKKDKLKTTLLKRILYIRVCGMQDIKNYAYIIAKWF